MATTSRRFQGALVICVGRRSRRRIRARLIEPRFALRIGVVGAVALMAPAVGASPASVPLVRDELSKTLPNRPTVETKAASSVTQTSATLNARVNPNDSEVSECSFEYGTSTGYGKTASCTPAPGSASNPVAVSAAITGLSPNTTYHFRISAASAGGPSKGADAESKTPAEPVLPSPPPVPPPPIVQAQPVVIPNSSFKVMGASLSLATYAITFVESVVDPGTFSWVTTFENGKYGVFAARGKKCKAGLIRLKGKCRPARVLFAKGSETVSNPGSVTFTVKPTRAGVKALKKAFKKNKGLPVTAVITYQSLRGGRPVSRMQSLIVKGRR